jgi:predicted phage terminase large subunit-like protein
MVAQLAAKWLPSAVLIEDKASGQSLIQELQRDTRLPVLAVKVDKDKVSRAYAITPTCEAGRVYLPERAAWLEDFLDELMMFPSGPHDDQVDTFTQGLHYLSQGGGCFGLLDWFEQEAAAEQEEEGPEKGGVWV